jgi:TetR/AcrR family transcriptional regulator, cholesterol catabolism regulator
VPPKKDPRRHAEVLDAAIALVRQKGIEGTSVQDIADAVGIKKGSVINYFSSKKQLAELIQERFTEVAVKELTAISQREDLAPDQKLKELLKFHAQHCALNMSSPVLVSFMQLWAPMSSDLGSRQLGIRYQYELQFIEQLQICVRKRIIRKVDAEITAHMMVGAMSWMAFWYHEDEHGPLAALVDKQVELWLDGLRPRPRGRARA